MDQTATRSTLKEDVPAAAPPAAPTAALADIATAGKTAEPAAGTFAAMGLERGLPEDIWPIIGVDPAMQTTPEAFEEFMRQPEIVYALPRATVYRLGEFIKNHERQYYETEDPAKREEIRGWVEQAFGQIGILRDFIENGPSAPMMEQIMAAQGQDGDPAEAAARIKEMVTKRPAPPAGMEAAGSEPAGQGGGKTAAPTASGLGFLSGIGNTFIEKYRAT
jgi:hypothetical protein